MKSLIVIVQSLALMCLCSTTYADFLFAFRQQAGTVIETVGNQRAIYLGRFEFDGPPPATDFTGIWAGVTIRDASNVRLFLGNGDQTFNGNTSMVDTGVVFTQLSNQPNAVAAPGLPPSVAGAGVAPIALSAPTGNALQQMISSSVSASFPNGYLDGWLVSNDTAHLFTAPSSSTSISGGTTPFNAFVAITAVPEPSSIALVGLLVAGAAVARFRHRRRFTFRHKSSRDATCG